jgi:hypothetical protein
MVRLPGARMKGVVEIGRNRQSLEREKQQDHRTAEQSISPKRVTRPK